MILVQGLSHRIGLSYGQASTVWSGTSVFLPVADHLARIVDLPQAHKE